MIPETAIFNDAGQVAMKFRRLRPAQVKCGGYTYVFIIQANIPMAWVQPEHVPCMLNARYGCCGVKKRGGVLFAHEADVRQWTNKGGR